MPALTPSTAHDDQEPAYRCTSCGRLLYDTELDRWACRVCEDTARTQLATMTELYQQLGAALAPGAAASQNTGHVTGATRTPPLPVNVTALDLRGPGGIVTLLLDIEDSWRRTLGWTTATFRGSAEQALPVVVGFLANNVGWACGMYEEVATDLRTIRQLHQRATAVVTGQREQRVPVGCCPTVNPSTGDVCRERLKVSPWGLQIRCNTCGTTWHRDEWLRLGAELRGLPLPASMIA